MDKSDISAFCIYTILGLAICKCIHFRWTKRNLYRFMSKFPGPKGIFTRWNLKILKYKDNVIHYISALYDEFNSNTITVWSGPMPALVTTELEFIEKICTSPDLQNKSIVYTPMKKLAQGGLVFLSDKEWQHHRKMLNPSFHNSLILKFIKTFNNAKNFAISEMNALADGREHKLDALMIYLTMRTTLDASFETELPKEEVYKMSGCLAYVIKEFLWKAVLGFMNLEFLSKFDTKMNNVLKYLRSAMKKIVDNKIMANMKTEVIQNDCTSQSYEAIKRTPKILLNQCIDMYKMNEFTYEEIITECLMLLGASFDTTGITMYSVLVMLAMHPDVQQRVFEEIESVYVDKDFEVENDHLRQLKYLEMVINETMRLMPPIVHIVRDVRKDTPISKDITLPKGLQVMVPIFHLHRRKDLWGPDAGDFKPERFLPVHFDKMHPYAYIPFSKGSRNCIGWRYAEVMMKIVLAGLIRNFKFETDYKYEDLQFESGIAIAYKEPPLLRIQQRA